MGFDPKGSNPDSPEGEINLDDTPWSLVGKDFGSRVGYIQHS